MPNVIRLFTSVMLVFSYLATAFVPGMPFQPSLMFASKARGLPKRKSFQVFHSGVFYWPNQEALVWTVKFPQEQTLVYYEH